MKAENKQPVDNQEDMSELENFNKLMDESFPKWEDYHDYVKRHELEDQAIKKLYIKHGLGWLVEFLTK